MSVALMPPTRKHQQLDVKEPINKAYVTLRRLWVHVGVDVIGELTAGHATLERFHQIKDVHISW
jgi:hypothetical protein